MFLKISQNSQEIACARVSFLIKKRLWYRPVNSAKFLRTPVLQNTSGGCFWKVKVSQTKWHAMNIHMLTCDLWRVTATSVNVDNFRSCLSKWEIEFSGDIFIPLENNSFSLKQNEYIKYYIFILEIIQNLQFKMLFKIEMLWVWKLLHGKIWIFFW